MLEDIEEINVVYSSGFENIPFQNRAKLRLRQAYAVLYFLINGAEAIRRASNCFPQIHDPYQTVESKISTQIGVSLDTFFSWYHNGTLLSELLKRLRLNEHDRLKNPIKYGIRREHNYVTTTGKNNNQGIQIYSIP